MILLALISGFCFCCPQTAQKIRERVDVQIHPRSVIRNVAWLAASVIVMLNCGCQSLNPWGRTKSLVEQSQARQLTCGGIDAAEKGRYDDACNCFSQAIKLSPQDPQIQVHLAQAYVEQGDLKSAISNLEQAVAKTELRGGDPSINVALGELYLANGQWLPAVRQADLALNRNGKLADAWALKGKTEYAKGNMSAALAHFHRAIGYQPKMPDVQIQIAETYQQMNQPLRALSTVEQLLSQYPPDRQPERALLAKGVALMSIQHVSSAIDVLQVASQRENVSSEVFVRLGQAQLLAGQTSQARMTLNRAKQLFPDENEIGELVTDLQSASQDVATITK